MYIPLLPRYRGSHSLMYMSQIPRYRDDDVSNRDTHVQRMKANG